MHPEDAAVFYQDAVLCNKCECMHVDEKAQAKKAPLLGVTYNCIKMVGCVVFYQWEPVGF